MRQLLSTSMIVLLFITCSFTTPQSEGLQWVDFNKGYELAKKTNKIMLVDVYTDWCGWCKRMDRDTYAKPEVIKMINQDFVAVKFNPEIKNVVYQFEGKSYTGEQLANVISNNQLTGYPATVFMLPKAKKSQLVGGYQTENEFKVILSEIKTAFKQAEPKKSRGK